MFSLHSAEGQRVGEAFQPEELSTMATAFEGAWSALDVTLDDRTPQVIKRLRSTLALAILEAARAGATDVNDLEKVALQKMPSNSVDGSR